MFAQNIYLLYYLSIPVQKLSCSGDEDTKDSSNSIACEAIIDVNTVPVTCSVSSVYEIGK